MCDKEKCEGLNDSQKLMLRVRCLELAVGMANARPEERYTGDDVLAVAKSFLDFVTD